MSTEQQTPKHVKPTFETAQTTPEPPEPPTPTIAKPKKSHKGVIILIVIAVLIAIYAIVTYAIGTNEQAATDTASSAPTMSKEEYIQSCTPVTYEDLARNPDAKKGQAVSVQGQVVQVMRQSDDAQTVLRVDITKDEHGYWHNNDVIWVDYAQPADTDNILEDDIVTIYGESKGEYTYETIFGADNTLPRIAANYIDITPDTTSEAEATTL